MSFLGRLLGNEAPRVPAGASVLIDDQLSSGVTGAGMDGGVWTFRVYWVMLDAQGNETTPRHYLGQTFDTNGDAEAYRDAVVNRTKLPDYPAGAV